MTTATHLPLRHGSIVRPLILLGTLCGASAGAELWFLLTVHGMASLLAFAGLAGLLGFGWAHWLCTPDGRTTDVDRPAVLPAAVDATTAVTEGPTRPTASATSSSVPSGLGWPEQHAAFSVSTGAVEQSYPS